MKNAEEKQRDEILDKVSFFAADSNNADLMLQTYLSEVCGELADESEDRSQQINEQTESARQKSALQLVDSVFSLN